MYISFLKTEWVFLEVKVNLITAYILVAQSIVDVGINIESVMNCHLLLNLLHELPTNVINLVINDNEFEILFIT